MELFRVFFHLLYVTLLANNGQAITDVDKIAEMYSEIDGNEKYVIFCNTSELRIKVYSFISECDKLDLKAHCSTTAPTLLEELKQCKKDLEENSNCKLTDFEGVPRCLQLLRKEWEMLSQAHAPCRDGLDDTKYQHVVNSCQQLQGKDEDDQYSCLSDSYDLLSSVDRCWNIVNLDLESMLKSMKEIENRMAQKITQFRDKGYKTCVYQPQMYLDKLRKYTSECDNAKTEERHYECRNEASTDYSFMTSDAELLESQCEDYEEFMNSNADTDLNDLFSDLEQGMAMVAKDLDGKVNEEMCPPFFYSAADAVIKRWSSEKHPEKKKELRAEILDASWGLIIASTITSSYQG